MNRNSRPNWADDLPEAFLAHKGDQPLDEVECIVADFVGMSRGKTMPSYKFNPGGTSFLPSTLFYQTVTGEYVDLDIKDMWTESDMVLRPDMATACAVPWADYVTLQVIHDLENRDGTPMPIAPRNVLKRVLKLYADRGLQPVVAPELEFYLIKPNVDPNEPIEPPIGRTGRRSASAQPYSMVAVDEYGPVIDMIYDYAEAQGIALDTVIQEGGAGQIEINLQHGDPLQLADQVFYFKRSIREAALKNGDFATFMAKPMRDEPGSAMHIHQSIIDTKTGRNIFSNKDGSASSAFYHFIGGTQKHMPSVVPIMAPYVNSYRRYKGGESAPTNIEWAEDNRTTGLRVPLSGPEARRLENRTLGMDCNPYLAIAASLACGYLGLSKKIAPRDPMKGETYDDCETLPRNLDDALEVMAADKDIHKMLGREFCTAYIAVKEAELEEFHAEISTWEREHLLLSV